MEIITRKQAKEQSLMFYFTGKKCRRGHLSKRLTANGSCRECYNEYYAKNKERILAVNTVYRNENRWVIREQQQENKEYHAIKAKQRYDSLKDDPIFIIENRNRVKEWKIQNKIKVVNTARERRMLQNNRIPEWANLEYILDIYRDCPKDYHVDHIVPLQGENVCGLHVHYNLQYLTVKENLKKGNKFPYEDYALWQ